MYDTMSLPCSERVKSNIKKVEEIGTGQFPALTITEYQVIVLYQRTIMNITAEYKAQINNQHSVITIQCNLSTGKASNKN